MNQFNPTIWKQRTPKPQPIIPISLEQQEEWLNKNTKQCSKGRVSLRQCKKIKALAKEEAKAMKDAYWTRRARGQAGVKIKKMFPCLTCPGWGKL